MPQAKSLKPFAEFLAEHPQLYAYLTAYYCSVLAVHNASVGLEATKARVLPLLTPVPVNGEAVTTVPTSSLPPEENTPSLVLRILQSLSGVSPHVPPTSRTVAFRVEHIKFCRSTLSLLLQGRHHSVHPVIGTTPTRVEQRIPLTDLPTMELLDSVAGATPLPKFSLKQRLLIKELIGSRELEITAMREHRQALDTLKEQPQFQELVDTLCPFKVGDYVQDNAVLSPEDLSPPPEGAQPVTYVGVELQHLDSTRQPRLEFTWVALGAHGPSRGNRRLEPVHLADGNLFSDDPYLFKAQHEPTYLPALFAEFYNQPAHA